jgi:hypothetical protein
VSQQRGGNLPNALLRPFPRQQPVSGAAQSHDLGSNVQNVAVFAVLVLCIVGFGVNRAHKRVR